jgi:iron complex transport system ATP-binding protein
MGATVELQKGGFGYANKEVFRDLNLKVEDGEILCLLGPNGCGKTTLLRCISGALGLNGGRVLLDGRDSASLDVTERARIIGFVFQEHTIAFPFSVLEVVRMGRTPYLGLFATPSSRDTEIAEEALRTVGLWHLRDRPYTQVSGGERQLALIARALTQNPRLLLLDEPTSHLDFGNQILILRIVRRLVRERGLTVVMATHFPNHAMMVSDRVALMSRGGLDRTGDPVETMTEASLHSLYGVKVRIVSVPEEGGGSSRVIVPVMDGPGSQR